MYSNDEESQKEESAQNPMEKSNPPIMPTEEKRDTSKEKCRDGR